MARNARLSPVPEGEERHDVTELLQRAFGGDVRSRDALLDKVYEELKRQAAIAMEGERAGHTLQPTALVHEAYLKLFSQRKADWHNRQQFYAIAKKAMRRLLVDYARQRSAAKRGDGLLLEALDTEVAAASSLDLETLIALEEALKELAAMCPRSSRIVRLKLEGLSNQEIADQLNLHPKAVSRDWMAGRAFLLQVLK